MKKAIKKFFKWVFKEEVEALQAQRNGWQLALNRCIEKEKQLDNILGNIDVSVDVHQYSRSWACVSIQGQKHDYIKFIDLGTKDANEISRFLHRYERHANIKIDASPGLDLQMKKWIKH